MRPSIFSSYNKLKNSIYAPQASTDCFRPLGLKVFVFRLFGPSVLSRLGSFCNCSSADSAKSTSQCIAPGEKEPCSGRGDCMACGTCVCYNPEQFEGPYCQYDKTQCPRHGGFLCNGVTFCDCQSDQSSVYVVKEKLGIACHKSVIISYKNPSRTRSFMLFGCFKSSFQIHVILCEGFSENVCCTRRTDVILSSPIRPRLLCYESVYVC